MDWDCEKSLNWDMGFELKINWDLGLGTPHKTAPVGCSAKLDQNLEHSEMMTQIEIQE